MSIAEKILRAKADLDDVFEAGKKLSDDGNFWDVFQDYGNSEGQNYYYAFFYDKWDDTNYNPKYDIIIANGITSGRNMYQASEITDTKVPIYANTNNMNMGFYGAHFLKTIPLFHVYETTVLSQTFQGCDALEEITIGGTIGQDIDIHWSPLTKESIVSVVSHLSDAASEKTLSLSSAAVEAGFSEEEWLSLVESKPNWTISLM